VASLDGSPSHYHGGKPPDRAGIAAVLLTKPIAAPRQRPSANT
jgi:hypothetical protein